MFCKKCGTTLENSAKYCPKCGTPVTQRQTAKTVLKPPQKRIQPPEKPKKNGTKLLALILSAVVVLGACSGLFVFREEILAFISSKKQFDENHVGEIYCAEIDPEHIATDDSGIMYADNEILLVANDGVSYKKIKNLADQYDAEIVGWIEQTDDYQLKLPDTYTMDELNETAAEMEKENIIDSAYVDYISEISKDSVNYGKEWSGEIWDENDHAGSNWGLEAIHALSAWDVLEEHKEKVNPIRLGLIDSGFDTDHEDLEDCFVDTFYNTSPNDHGTHVAGIMAANSDNNKGICGVYPYGKGNLYGVSWVGIQGYSENLTSCMLEKCAYSELILRNVKAINCSYGYDVNLVHLNNLQKIHDELAKELEEFFLRLLDKGYDFVIIQSSGNSSNEYYTKLKVDSDGDVILDRAGKATYDEKGEYTKIYYQNGGLAVKGWYYKKDEKSKGKKINGLNTSKDNENVYNSGWVDCNYTNQIILFKNENLKNRVIVVGSIGIETNHSETLFDQKININSSNYGYHISKYSNLGERLDVVAPGGDEYKKIYSTLTNNSYGYLCGTSMAAPHVAGVAAMVWAANNNLTGAEVKEIICSTANNLISQPGSSYYKTDYKLVDAKSAVEKALGIEKEKSTDPQNGGILGWVVNKDNEDEKIEEATVTVTNIDTGEPESTKTDSNGHFELILPEGSYTLTVTANGYEDYTWSDGNESFQNPIEVKNNGVNYLDDWIKMKKSSNSISGTITDESGNPIKNAEVTAAATLSDTLANKTAKTDSNGYFQISCGVGSYQIRVKASGYEDYESSESVKVESGIETILDTIQLKKSNSETNTPEIVQAVLDSEELWLDPLNEISMDGYNECWFQDIDMDGTPEFIAGGNVQGAHGARCFYIYYLENHELKPMENANKPNSYKSNEIDFWPPNSAGNSVDGQAGFSCQLYKDNNIDRYKYIYADEDGVAAENYQILNEIYTTELNDNKSTFSILNVMTITEEYKNNNVEYSYDVGIGNSTNAADREGILGLYDEYFKNLTAYKTTVHAIPCSKISADQQGYYDTMSREDKKQALIDSYYAWSYKENPSAELPLSDIIGQLRNLQATLTESSMQSETKTVQNEKIRKCYINVLNNTRIDYEKNPDNFNINIMYWLYDLDKDGICELFVDSGTCEVNRVIHVYRYDIDSETAIDTGQASSWHTGLYYSSELDSLVAWAQGPSDNGFYVTITKYGLQGNALQTDRIYDGELSDSPYQSEQFVEIPFTYAEDTSTIFNYFPS